VVGYGMLQAFNLGKQEIKNCKYKCKNEVYKNGYRRRSCTCKTAQIHRRMLLALVMKQYITNLTIRWIFLVLDVQLRRL